MKGDGRHTPTGCEDPDCGSQSRLEAAQLVVDLHADGLEGPCRGMDVPGPRRPRDRVLDRFGELASGRERSPTDDEFGDPGRPAFLAESRDDPGELALIHSVDQLRGGHRLPGVHPHVERRISPEAEAALGCVELVAGKPEVEEHAVDAVKRCLAGEALEIGEVALDQLRWRVEAGQRLPAPVDGGGIAIDPEQHSARLDALEQGSGVPSASQGGVDEDTARTGLKELYCFL